MTNRFPWRGSCTTRPAAVRMQRGYQRLPHGYGLIPSMSRTDNCWENARVELFLGQSSVSQVFSIGTSSRESKRHRTSLSISRCSIIGSGATRPSAIDLPLSLRLGQLSRNPVSTKSGEGHTLRCSLIGSCASRPSAITSPAEYEARATVA